MKAAVQIAERWAGLYMTVCTSENPDAATLISLIEELSAAEERERVLREALEWQPITPENLPKSGDEIYRARGEWPNDVGDVMSECEAYDDAEVYHRYGFTHFRPISPPAAPEQGKEAKS